VTRETLRAIPPIHELLKTPAARDLAGRTSPEFVRERLREIVEALRAEIADGRLDARPDEISREIGMRLVALERSDGSLRRVVNATGVVLHTNLGRAPLSARAVRAIAEVASGYSNLEYDLSSGRRGERDAHGEAYLCDLLTGPSRRCEAAVVANNNAAAVMLVLNTFAQGGEVIVSRGELVEIGGGFRVPEVLERAGCVLREVGTTNRTRASDYENAIGERTRMLLRVHPSNYRIVGFTERPTVRELAEIARRHGLPLVEDLGSGCVVDLRPIGIDEVRVQDVLAEGVDLATFSGDKLLGGPQAGIVAGRKDLVDGLRRNPLMRALRVDKMVYAALEATLAAYVEGRAFAEVPALRMLAEGVGAVRARAESLAARLTDPRLRARIEEGLSVPGAGSAPGSEIPTALLVVDREGLSVMELDSRLRAHSPPVIARIERDRVVLDLRTVAPEDDIMLAAALDSVSAER
jgi:L-seryl-tRNA(Ser) seleniumtransferase